MHSSVSVCRVTVADDKAGYIIETNLKSLNEGQNAVQCPEIHRAWVGV